MSRHEKNRGPFCITCRHKELRDASLDELQGRLWYCPEIMQYTGDESPECGQYGKEADDDK